MRAQEFIDNVEGCYGTYNQVQLGFVTEYIDRLSDRERDVLFELVLKTHKQGRSPFIGVFESLSGDVYEIMRTRPGIDQAPAGTKLIADDAVDHREEVAQLLSGLLEKLKERGDAN